MAFPSKSGCPMCSIVARASSCTSPLSLSPSPDSPSIIPSSPSFSASAQLPSRARAAGKARERPGDEREIIWHDETFTVYRERAKPVSSIAHLVIIFNLHVPSLYMLSTSDVPLLVQLRELAHRLLSDITSARDPSSPAIRPASPISPFAPLTASPSSSATVLPPSSPSLPVPEQVQTSDDAELVSKFRVGFITPPWKDPSIPVKDHLHAHAYVAPMDRCSWWRSVAYSPLAWYAVEDLVAEIREESTNNRIRSSTLPTSTSSTPRNSGSSYGTGAGEHNNNSDTRLLKPKPRPIDRVADAGARSGTASGYETTRESIAGLTDLEAGRRSVGRSSTGSAQGSLRGGTSTSTGGRLSPGPNSSSNKSPLTPPTAARLAAPSHLDLNAAYSYSVASASSATSTPTKSSFS